MGIKTTKVQLLAIAALAGWLLPLNEASLCQPGVQYWSNESEACVNCKKCDSSIQHVVIRPCQAHTDTICGPVSALDIDWSWLKHKHHDKDKHHKASEPSLCQPGVQYWSNESEACVNCKKCDSSIQQLVIRPCQVRTDTICGPMSALDNDWSWLKHKHHDKDKHHKASDPSLCQPGVQYWSNESEACVNCKKCDSSIQHVVIRPCQAHTDTVCGPVSALDNDWSWLNHKHHDKDKHHKASDPSLCQPGVQYWSHESEACVNCKKCDSSTQHVVIRPCQTHTDTICGPVSALDNDWSWLKHKHHDKDKHHKASDPSVDKKHHKKAHSHDESLTDDQESRPFHHSFLDDEVESVPALNHHREKNHLKHGFSNEKKDHLGKKPLVEKHHSPPENFLSEEFDEILDYKKPHKIPPPPPLKSADDLEKEWKEWLILSKNTLQHRKDDLLKNLHKESPYNDKHHSINRLNERRGNIFDDDSTFPHGAHHKDHPFKKHFSPLDLELFDRLINHEHQRQERLSLSHLLGAESSHEDLLDILKSESKQHDKFRNGDDLGFPMDTFNFQSALPTGRLILGEPSTVSEIMDQDLSEDSEDETVKDGEDGGVVAVPFTAAERLVWDWQALALASAVAACFLFFTVVAVFSVLHARQWRQIKSHIHNDVEEMSAKVSLMQSHNASGSAADAANTNLYLEKLLENNGKKSSNIYTQKRPSS